MAYINKKTKQLIQILEDRNIQQEFKFTASRSGGAGGQNVNKVNTKVEMRFNIKGSLLLTEQEKLTLCDKLADKLVQESELIVTSTQTRSQLKNKELCITKLIFILAKALIPETPHIETKPSKQAKERRIQEKKQRSQIKQSRMKLKE